MSDHDEPTRDGGDGDVVARLLRIAGPRPLVPEDRAARVRQAVFRHWRATTRRRRGMFWASWLALSLAAASVLLGAGWRLARRVPGGPPPAGASIATLIRAEGSPRAGDGAPATQGSPLSPGSALLTGPADRAALRMQGGAVVRLDRHTAIRLESSASVTLERGAVYVDAGPAGTDHALAEIRTPEGNVRHVGTRYEVRLLESGLEVRVREGGVRLERRDGAYDAGAGDRLSVQRDGTVGRTRIPPDSPEWGWILEVAPPFVLEGATLRAFLDWVSAETGWKVRFGDPAMGGEVLDVVLHGSIAGLRPDQAPGAVLPTCGLGHRLEGDTLLIDRAGAAGGDIPGRGGQGGVR
jgi:FecR-like protein